MPYKPIPCVGKGCRTLRQRGGRTDATGLCWECWVKAGRPKPSTGTRGLVGSEKKRRGLVQPRGWKAKPMPAQRIQGEREADKVAKYPTSSWWADSERFSENYQRELPRMQAIGAEVPRSMRPVGE